jgi:hypothetical protein
MLTLVMHCTLCTRMFTPGRGGGFQRSLVLETVDVTRWVRYTVILVIHSLQMACAECQSLGPA